MTEPVSAEKKALYRRAALEREEARRQAGSVRRQAGSVRRQAALAVAQQTAALLKQNYGATRVVLYGSTAHGRWFHDDSDIDLAAEGIPADSYLRAWNAVDALTPDFEVNLLDWGDATPALLESIEREGIPL